MQGCRIAVAGAGIYGATIAIKLASAGHKVTLYDPLGVLMAASAINQFRVHAGYHYPRSLETIKEVIDSRKGFLAEYSDAIVKDIDNFYAIPHERSLTSPNQFEAVMGSVGLPCDQVTPSWIDYDFIDKCYQVQEEVYDPFVLREILMVRIKSQKIEFIKEELTNELSNSYDFTVFATYGGSGSHMHLFKDIRIQVVEKIQVRLPVTLANKSLVVIDGPFTAFDPYGASGYSQFGSALYTNHWMTSDPTEPVPSIYKNIMNLPEMAQYEFSNFEKMREEASQVVPECKAAEYIGSRFTRRLVEHAPASDRRIMRIGQTDNRTIHVFSGKVVGALKAARIVCDEIKNA